jgi:hypothetical protein
VGGEKDRKAEKTMKSEILAAGRTELHPSDWHRGVHVFACNDLHSCVHCAHVSLPQFCVTAARCLRAVSAPCYQGSANPLAIITLSYTARSSPNIRKNIRKNTYNSKSACFRSYLHFHRYPRAPSQAQRRYPGGNRLSMLIRLPPKYRALTQDGPHLLEWPVVRASEQLCMKNS